MKKQWMFMIGGSAVIWACPAGAQTTAAPTGPMTASQSTQENQDSDGLADIVVTAQKRSENVQNVPIAITAFSQQALQARGLGNVTQVSDFTPNIQIDSASQFAGSSQAISAYIRGIGQNDFAFNLEPGVGIYIDGVYLARTIGAAVDLLDIDHVEVLKGPQGTLFGRNTIGGAISIVTRAPAKEFGYAADVTTGGYNRLDIRGSMDLPISDTLGALVSFSSKTRDGYQKRVPFPGAGNTISDLGRFRSAAPPGGDDTQGNENVQTARVKLRWTPSSVFNATLSFDGSRSREEATPSTLLGVVSNGGTVGDIYNACIGAPAGAIPPLAAVCGPRGSVGGALAGANADADPNNNRLPWDSRYITGNPDVSYARGSNFSRIDTWGVSLNAEWQFSDAVKLRSITAYRELKGTFGVENGGAPFVVTDTSFQMRQHQISQEFQLTADAFDDRLHMLVGAYGFYEKGSFFDYVNFFEGLIQVYGPNYLRNKAGAVFTHNTFKVSDKFSVTLGLRYTEEDKKFEGQQQELNRFALKLGFPPFLYPDPTNLDRVYPLGVYRQKFRDTSVRLGAEYKPSRDILAYVSFAQGFKSGGWTTRLNAPEPGNVPPTFRPEKANTYEVGLKTELFDRKLRLNGAAFLTDYKDIQIVVYNGISPVFQNAGTGRIKGFELEAEARPTPALSLNAGLGYLDAGYRRLAPGATVALSNKFVNTPELSATAGANYRYELDNGARVDLRGDYVHKSSQAKDAVNTPLLVQGPIDLFDASLTYSAPGNRWQLMAGGRNLTNKRYLIAGVDSESVGFISGTYNRPREWYLTLRIRSR